MNNSLLTAKTDHLIHVPTNSHGWNNRVVGSFGWPETIGTGWIQTKITAPVLQCKPASWWGKSLYNMH